MINQLPGWAEQMRDLFRSGSVAQFLIHGNIFDVVGVEDNSGGRLLSLGTASLSILGYEREARVVRGWNWSSEVS